MIILEMTDEQEARYNELARRTAELVRRITDTAIGSSGLNKVECELTDIAYEIAEMLDFMICDARS